MLNKIRKLSTVTIFLACYLLGLIVGLSIYDITNYIVEIETYDFDEILPLILLLIITIIGSSAIGIYFGVKLSLNFHKNVTEHAERKQNYE